MGYVKIFPTIVFIGIFAGGAIAEELCKFSDGKLTKPILHGHVQDAGQQLAFDWRSTANDQYTGAAGWWEIENLICNSGTKNLIVSWPKTSIYNGAFGPLPPGGVNSNSFSIGGVEPEPGISEIIYGYNGATTTAQHYQAKFKNASLHPLYSRIQGVIARGDSGNTSDKPTNQFVYYFQSTPLDGSYEFIFYPKTEYSLSLWVAISSDQNKDFVKALSEQKISATVEKLTEFTKNIPKNLEPKLLSSEFVFVAPRKTYEPIKVRMPVAPANVELARVVLLDIDHNPISAGYIALFAK